MAYTGIELNEIEDEIFFKFSKDEEEEIKLEINVLKKVS